MDYRVKQKNKCQTDGPRTIKTRKSDEEYEI